MPRIDDGAGPAAAIGQGQGCDKLAFRNEKRTGLCRYVRAAWRPLEPCRPSIHTKAVGNPLLHGNFRPAASTLGRISV